MVLYFHNLADLVSLFNVFKFFIFSFSTFLSLSQDNWLFMKSFINFWLSGWRPYLWITLLMFQFAEDELEGNEEPLSVQLACTYHTVAPLLCSASSQCWWLQSVYWVPAWENTKAWEVIITMIPQLHKGKAKGESWLRLARQCSSTGWI